MWPQAMPSYMISIHAPREGSDAHCSYRAAMYCKFLSTLPVRGATYAGLQHAGSLQISIHAPREGSDYPRSP